MGLIRLPLPVAAAHAGLVQIRLITPNDDSDFTAWFDVRLAAQLADFPQGPQWRQRELQVVYQGNEHHDGRLWLAEEDGVAVGAAVMGLPLRDNLSLAEPEIYVLPEARRRGVGTALLEAAVAEARENGRTSLLSYLDGPAGSPTTPGTAFAERHGFTRRITEIARAQRPPFDLDAIRAAEAAALAHSDGYRIVTWRDRAPDEYIDEFARLEARLSTDAPLGDLDYEPEVWDADRIRTSEERQARMGRQTWNAAAIAPDGTTMAGVTRISLASDSDVSGFQNTTIVDPGHRGHRLGLLVKAANFEALHRDRPGVQAIWTWNADSNEHMIAINETLGYRVEGWSAGYQRDL